MNTNNTNFDKLSADGIAHATTEAIFGEKDKIFMREIVHEIVAELKTEAIHLIKKNKRLAFILGISAGLTILWLKICKKLTVSWTKEGCAEAIAEA